MNSSPRHWKNRFETSPSETPTPSPSEHEIVITKEEGRDVLLEKNIILKKILVHPCTHLEDLARFLWHYEVSLNFKAMNNSSGKTLLKLVDAQYDDEEHAFIIVTECGGSPVRDFLEGGRTSNPNYETFASFVKNKKRFWEAVAHLVSGIKSLHSAGLIHRNISPDTVYFDEEAYLQGEKEVLKLGDYTWSIYLYSVTKILTSKFTEDLIQDNLHLFRAPECVPSEGESFATPRGECNQSDLYSLGLLLVFMRSKLDLQDYEDRTTPIQTRITEIRENFENMGNITPDERDIILKLVEVDPEDRFSSALSLLNVINEFLKKLEFNRQYYETLPIHFTLSSTSGFLRRIADRINTRINDIIRYPNQFMEQEFHEVDLCLTNNTDYPVWFRGQSGTYYKLAPTWSDRRRVPTLMVIDYTERDIEKTSVVVSHVKHIVWQDQDTGSPSLNQWPEILASAVDLIKESNVIQTAEEKERARWFQALKVILDAEERLLAEEIFEFNKIDMANQPEQETLLLNVINDPKREIFQNVAEKKDTNFVELIPSRNFREDFREKRKWEVVDWQKEGYDSVVVQLQRNSKGIEPPEHGFIRFWDLKKSKSLLIRKRRILQNLEDCELLIEALLHPASSHRHIMREREEDIITRVYNTEPIFLLQGPPGTGKTWTAKKLIELTLQHDPYARILVTSKEHFVLDDLLAKTHELLDEMTISPKPTIVRLISTEREHLYSTTSIPFSHFTKSATKSLLENLAAWEPVDEMWKEQAEELRSQVQVEFESPSREWLDLTKAGANVVFCTSTAGELYFYADDFPRFDLVIMEESGKAFPSELLLPLQLGNKWVLIGDQNQLPPFRIEDIERIVDEILDDQMLELQDQPTFQQRDFIEFRKEVKGEIRMFENLFRRFQDVRFYDPDPLTSYETLREQRRLPPKISEMISSVFYDQPFVPIAKDPPPGSFIVSPVDLRDEQLVWIDTPYTNTFREVRRGHNLSNPSEARAVRKLLKRLRFKDPNDISLAIITPYSEQVGVLGREIPNSLPNLPGINLRQSIYTIDSFQGKEADLIIISLVRNNRLNNPRAAWGFIPTPERLNVMFSRARKCNIVVGNHGLCKIFEEQSSMLKFNQVARFFKVVDVREVLGE